MEIKPVEKIGNYKIHYDNEHCIGFVPLDPKALEMTAKEMFEELGYEQTKTKSFIKYTYKKYISNWYHIMFDLEEKTIDCYISNDSPFSPSEPFSITIKELKAINKQAEELWGGK